MVNLTPLSGPVCVGLGSGGMAISPVLPIATRNLSYHYQQKCAGKPIGRCVHLIDGSRCFEMAEGGEATSLSGPIWVDLGSSGGGLSDVVQISMKNYHITASNSALESPSAAKFNALTFKVIEKLQKGGR